MIPTTLTREKIERLQSELSALPQYEPITKHFFHGGMYCREVWRDAGVVVVGKVHKKEHFYLIVSGCVSVDGGPPVYGPHLIMSEPGTKRAVFSLEPTLCMTFHRTDATTVEEAEAELVEEDRTALFNADNKVQGLLS